MAPEGNAFGGVLIARSSYDSFKDNDVTILSNEN
jgi:hypothetical protein